ncbi:MAG: AAA family ATPase [Rhizobiaceae bacterium]
MKLITFASFKGGSGKTTSVMAVCSSFVAQGIKVALIDADENGPLSDWQKSAERSKTWTTDCRVYQADDLRSFEAAYEDADNAGFDTAIIDTRGGGSELNNACVVNTNTVIIPSALTTLDMRAALTTFEHTVQLLQDMNLDIPVSLLIQRVPVGKLTVSQQGDLERLSDLPRCKTIMHARDAFAAISKRGLLHKTHAQLIKNPMKRISASHIATAMLEADALAEELLVTIGTK